jgi:hypothetical protein
MTAAAANRVTRQLGAGAVAQDPPAVPVRAGRHIYDGTIVMATAAGFATDVAAASQTCLGKAAGEADNTGGADGAITVFVRRGTHAWANDGGDPVVAADLYATVYMTDNQTVCHTAAGKSAVGKFLGFDPADGVSCLVETL